MNEPDPMSSVLAVCSGSGRRDTLYELLSEAFDLTVVTDIDSALEYLAVSDDVACVVTTEDLPDGSGIDLASAIRERDSDLPVILWTATVDGSLASAATAAGVTDYLPEPLDSDGSDLRDRIADAIGQYQRRYEQSRNSEMFTSILADIPVALYVKDEEGRHLRLSDVPGGADPTEAFGKTDFELHGHENSAQAYQDDLAVIETGESVIGKREMHATGGVPIWLETTKVPWYDDDGSVQGLLGLTYEITDLKHTERKLRRRIHWLERFTDYVTHDLRNPMHVAQGNLELAQLHLADGESEKAAESLSKVDEALERMDDVIEDISEMAETADLEADTSQRIEAIELAGIFEEVWDRLETDGNVLENTIPRHARLYAVRSYLYPLVENLFKNAIEHAGPAATVTVGLSEDGFFVADDGPGIPDSEAEKLDRPEYSQDEGTGTGLNIVADIVVAHNWSIAVGESEVDGTRFTFGNCLLVADDRPSLEAVESLSLTDNTDIGDVKVPGSAQYDSSADRWTVTGAGEDLWRDTNEFHFVYREVDAPVRITGTVAAVEDINEYSKAGLMIRGGRDETATFGFVGKTASHGDEILWRRYSDEPTVSKQFDRDDSDDRFRLTFDGHAVTAAVSVSGDWETIDQRPIETSGSVFVGLAGCSVTPRYPCEAVFEDVTVERLEEP